MNSTDLLIRILEWAWVVLFGAVIELFRRFFRNDKRISLLEREAELDRERRAEEREAAKDDKAETTAWRNEVTTALKDHNDTVVNAINGTKTELTKQIDTVRDDVRAVNARVDKLHENHG